jgi:proteasome lid subunit RPN8/RPN11
MANRRIRLTAGQWADVVGHLAACLPEEGCGLLAGHADRVELVLPIENADHSPVHYTMEPRALVSALGRLETLGLELLGAFHSHPAGPFGVSESDVREWHYPEAALMVCAPREEAWGARAFIVDGSRVAEVPVQFE